MQNIERTLTNISQFLKRFEIARRRADIINEKKEKPQGTEQPQNIDPEEDETRI